MFSQVLCIAIGLVFVIEGLLPFLMPKVWRHTMQKLVLQNDRSLRIFGFVSMLLGIVVLSLFKN